jgi:replicative DNA helicase
MSPPERGDGPGHEPEPTVIFKPLTVDLSREVGLLVIPEASEEEEHVLACCAASRHGASLAHERLSPDNFYTPAARRVFEAAVLPEVAAATTYSERVVLIAELGDVDVIWLERCLDDRPSFLDEAGASAGAVKEAWARRGIMRAASDLFRCAATGGLDDLQQCLEAVSDAS